MSSNQEKMNISKMKKIWKKHIINNANVIYKLLSDNGLIIYTKSHSHQKIDEGEEEQPGDEIIEDDHGVRCRVDYDEDGNEDGYTPVEPHCVNCGYIVNECNCELDNEILNWFQIDKQLYDLVIEIIPVARLNDQNEEMYFLGCHLNEDFYKCLEPAIDLFN